MHALRNPTRNECPTCGAHPYAACHRVNREAEALKHPHDDRLRMARTEESNNMDFRADLVGVNEIADRAGVKPNTVVTWRRRHPNFPVPITTLAIGDIWIWADVEPWVVQQKKKAKRYAT